MRRHNYRKPEETVEAEALKDRSDYGDDRANAHYSRQECENDAERRTRLCDSSEALELTRWLLSLLVGSETKTYESPLKIDCQNRP
jgi:hypothetical protein